MHICVYAYLYVCMHQQCSAGELVQMGARWEGGTPQPLITFAADVSEVVRKVLTDTVLCSFPATEIEQ